MQMKRYQMYLEPKAVQTIDMLSQGIGISRSRLIQDVVSRVVCEYEKVLSVPQFIDASKHPLLQMAGMIKGVKRTGRSIAENVDEIYLRD